MGVMRWDVMVTARALDFRNPSQHWEPAHAPPSAPPATGTPCSSALGVCPLPPWLGCTHPTLGRGVPLAAEPWARWAHEAAEAALFSPRRFPSLSDPYCLSFHRGLRSGLQSCEHSASRTLAMAPPARPAALWLYLGTSASLALGPLCTHGSHGPECYSQRSLSSVSSPTGLWLRRLSTI